MSLKLHSTQPAVHSCGLNTPPSPIAPVCLSHSALLALKVTGPVAIAIQCLTMCQWAAFKSKLDEDRNKMYRFDCGCADREIPHPKIGKFLIWSLLKGNCKSQAIYHCSIMQPLS